MNAMEARRYLLSVSSDPPIEIVEQIEDRRHFGRNYAIKANIAGLHVQVTRDRGQYFAAIGPAGGEMHDLYLIFEYLWRLSMGRSLDVSNIEFGSWRRDS